MPESLDLGIGKSQGGCVLVFDMNGMVQFLKRFFGQYAIVADPFIVEEPTIGLKADLPGMKPHRAPCT